MKSLYKLAIIVGFAGSQVYTANYQLTGVTSASSCEALTLANIATFTPRDCIRQAIREAAKGTLSLKIFDALFAKFKQPLTAAFFSKALKDFDTTQRLEPDFFEFYQKHGGTVVKPNGSSVRMKFTLTNKKPAQGASSVS